MRAEYTPADSGKVGLFAGYDDPGSHFSRRLAAVQDAVRDALGAMPPGPIVVVDICSGVGRAVLPILPSHARLADIRAWLLELDARSAAIARKTVHDAVLTGVRIVETDAGLSTSYVGVPRANLVIMSGVLAHLSNADRTRTLRFLRQICAPGATLIWTIGIHWNPWRIRTVRRSVTEAGFSPLALRSVARWRWGGGARHEIGAARMTCEPEALEPGARVFAFQPSLRGRFRSVRRVARLALRPLR